MHLSHRVPTIWYRASLSYPHPDLPKDRVSITGVTLPGTPFIVVGSNTYIAWGFTNTAGDWVDLVELDINKGQYMTNDGPKPLERWTETIHIKGQDRLSLNIQAPTGGRWSSRPTTIRNMPCAGLRTVRRRPMFIW